MHDLSPFDQLIASSTDQQIQQGRATRRLRMSITFVDSSVLHVRENYVTVSGWIDYSYHWQTADNQLIHRWDNAHEVPFSTSPHHQHVNVEDNVQPFEPVTLTDVLSIISRRITSG